MSLLMLADHSPGRIDAAPTAGAYRQLHLDVIQTCRPLIDCATDLTIGNAVADTDVHVAALRGPWRLIGCSK